MPHKHHHEYYTEAAFTSAATYAGRYLYDNYLEPAFRTSTNSPYKASRENMEEVLGSSEAVRSSASVEQSGPVQHMSFHEHVHVSRGMKRNRHQMAIVKETQPWLKFNKEIGYHEQSRVFSSTTEPCTYFGYDLAYFFGNSNPVGTNTGAFGPRNPYAPSATRYSDLDYILDTAGLANPNLNNQIEIDHIRAENELTNNTNVGVELEVYYCVTRDADSTVSPNAQSGFSVGIMDKFYYFLTQDGVSTSLASNTTPANAIETSSRITPYMSSSFCSNVKILQQKRCRLGPGETLKIHWQSPCKGVYMTDSLAKEAVQPQYCRHLLIRACGQIGLSGVAGSRVPAHMPVDILSIMHEYAQCRLLPGGASSVNFTNAIGGVAPTTTGTNLIVQVGNSDATAPVFAAGTD